MLSALSSHKKKEPLKALAKTLSPIKTALKKVFLLPDMVPNVTALFQSFCLLIYHRVIKLPNADRVVETGGN